MYSKDLIELLFVQPYCRIELVSDKLGITRQTSSRYLKELESIGILKSQNLGKETLFINEELFGILRE